MNARCAVIAVALSVTYLGVSELASADPLPNQVLKFQQLPLNNGGPVNLAGAPNPRAPYYGHDELSTAVRTSNDIPWTGTYMADDFADEFNTPVVHVRWWGSYIEDLYGDGGVKDFLISFEKDVPAGDDNPFSHPGEPLLNQVVTKVAAGPLAPGSGTFTEKLVPTPPMDGMPPREALYEYNAELNLGKEFRQEPDTVYWLKIVALVDVQRDGQVQWGWHSRDWSVRDPLASTPPAVVPGEHMVPPPIVDPDKGFSSDVWHFQDDAVSGPITVFPNPDMPNMPDIEQFGWEPQNYLPPWDGPSIIGQYSKDLAFELYTVPEPSTVMLIGLATLAWAAALRRR